MIRRIARTLHRDDGLSLAEVLVYSLLLGIILAAAAGIFASSVRTEDQVRDSSNATSTATVVADAIAAGVRNSSTFNVIDGSAAGDQLLRARTSTVRLNSSGIPVTTWACAAWYYDASERALFYARQGSAFPATVDPIAGGWQRIGDGIDVVDGLTPVFSGTTALALNYIVTSDSASPVRVSNLIYKRLQADTTTGPVACF